LDWTLVQISPSEDVFVSDIDVMRNISTSVRVNNESAAQGQSPQSCALTMSFSLPKSSYATIAMRELMKGE
jgi:tRNA(Glu) U13 pseudouridine synthase TruD